MILRGSRASAVHDERYAGAVHPADDADEPGPADARERDATRLAHEEDDLVLVERLAGLEVERAREERVAARLGLEIVNVEQPMSGLFSNESAMS